MTLLDLRQGEKGFVVKVRGRGAFRKRIMEMGFVTGKLVTVIKKAPLKDPVEYDIMGYHVSLRNDEASLIEVQSFQTRPSSGTARAFNGTIDQPTGKIPAYPRQKTIQVALVGNPNSGKTTLFNMACGTSERVGNYTGVTVDAKKGKMKLNDYYFQILDLPGTYSITSYSPEEIFVRKHIVEKIPDVVVNVVDSSNLERNLYLTTQLIDMDIKVVVALNMYDELQKRGDRFDYMSLARMIGIPIVPTVSSRGKGIRELFEKVIEVYEDRDPVVRHIHIHYGETMEESINRIQEKIRTDGNRFITNIIAPRFLALKLLEQDQEARRTIEACQNKEEISRTVAQETDRVERSYGDSSESVITDAKFGFISGALKETLFPGSAEYKRKSDVIDAFFTHKVWGFPIFFGFLWIMFEATFRLGKYPERWIESGVSGLSGLLASSMSDGMFKDLLIDGIISGIGGVIVFLPNILILFLFISVMEDTGYMARAVFIMDKVMHRIGLHGKSFIPMIMGFGCNVPAIMATRTIENRNDRLITMLINPFFSCSARLPVYVLLISAFFTEHSGTILFLIYLIGIILAVLTALLLKHTFFRTVQVPFVMELPPYRIPTLRGILKHMWGKGLLYLRKISSVILIATIVIWALGYFPRNITYSTDFDARFKELKEMYEPKRSAGDIPDRANRESLEKEYAQAVSQLRLQQRSEKQEQSYIGRLGHWIEPVIEPLGFDWRMGISILSGVSAKEIVVSTMGVLYQAEDDPAAKGGTSLVRKLQTQIYTSGPKAGQPVFTPLVAFGFMIFVLIYFPCFGTLATISRESGSWKWGAFSLIYTTLAAWLMAFIVYQAGNLIL